MNDAHTRTIVTPLVAKVFEYKVFLHVYSDTYPWPCRINSNDLENNGAIQF